MKFNRLITNPKNINKSLVQKMKSKEVVPDLKIGQIREFSKKKFKWNKNKINNNIKLEKEKTKRFSTR